MALMSEEEWEESAMLSTGASDWSVALPTPKSHSRSRLHLCASLPTGLSLLLAEKVSMMPGSQLEA